MLTCSKARTSVSRRVAMSMPRVPAWHASIDPKNLCVCSTSFPPRRCLSSTTSTRTPAFAISMAAVRPAGPPPMTRHSTWTVSMGCIAGRPSTSGSTGRPSSGCTFMPGPTRVMHAFTGRPSATTVHWAHWPLAQKRPCGAASLWWWPKVRTPLAKRAEAMVSSGTAWKVRPCQENGTVAPAAGARMGCSWMRRSRGSAISGSGNGMSGPARDGCRGGVTCGTAVVGDHRGRARVGGVGDAARRRNRTGKG